MPGDARVQEPVTVRMFTQLFSSTPRGARLARRLVTHRLDAWGCAYGTEVNEAVTLVVAELAANAVRHGRVHGRDFRVRLLLCEGTVRVEVADARADRLPTVREPSNEGGRGLLLVAALAERWGAEARPDGLFKTVWAELTMSRMLS
ncbi:ATP-binding protein [Streptomyces sp. NPDC050704]|uniref:ATP-binding protein n=1 Tax=Streptomyces sp. NPDC050704 TaxID=3157219 RepID=UPI00341F19D3